MAGLDRPTTGAILEDGHEAFKDPYRQRRIVNATGPWVTGL
jgi:glycerol-3-phosphate dehydrogenase